MECIKNYELWSTKKKCFHIHVKFKYSGRTFIRWKKMEILFDLIVKLVRNTEKKEWIIFLFCLFFIFIMLPLSNICICSFYEYWPLCYSNTFKNRFTCVCNVVIQIRWLLIFIGFVVVVFFFSFFAFQIFPWESTSQISACYDIVSTHNHVNTNTHPHA